MKARGRVGALVILVACLVAPPAWGDKEECIDLHRAIAGAQARGRASRREERFWSRAPARSAPASFRT